MTEHIEINPEDFKAQGEVEKKARPAPLFTEVVEAFAKLITRWANPEGLSWSDIKGDRDLYRRRKGIDVLYHRHLSGLALLRFVTYDGLLVEMEFDAGRIQREGRQYLDSRVELIADQIIKAREVKQKEESLMVLQSFNPKQDIGSLVRKAIGSGRAVPEDEAANG